jgi:hypothetical protein
MIRLYFPVCTDSYLSGTITKCLEHLAGGLNVMTCMNYCSSAVNAAIYECSAVATSKQHRPTVTSALFPLHTIDRRLYAGQALCQLYGLFASAKPQCSWLHLNHLTNGVNVHLIAVLHSAAGAVVAATRRGGPRIAELRQDCRYYSYTNGLYYVGNITYA